ncbi:MAG TPA: MinD/ParA family protein [Thiotrichales bacterium]|nr:MinD/ParA family protein [Thiotrichales bacterium]
MPRIITIGSGKGGVGKTFLSVNLAAEFARRGQRVCLFDADLGLANANILLGLKPEHTLEDVIDGRRSLPEILVSAGSRLDVVPGASGVERLANLALEDAARIQEQLAWLNRYDLVLFDASSGVGQTVLQLALASPEVLLVMTPEPTALTDAYAFLKLLRQKSFPGRLRVVVNNAHTEAAAAHTYRKFREVARVYLRAAPDLLGTIPRDEAVNRAVQQQRPLIHAEPESLAGRAIGALADALGDGRGDADLVEFWWRYTNVPLPVIESGVEQSEPEAPAAVAGEVEEAAEQAPAEEPLSVEEKVERLGRLLATVQEELDTVRAGLARFSAVSEAPRRGRRQGDAWPADLPGHSSAVRTGQRPAPIDHPALRRVIGRLMVRALAGQGGGGAVSVQSENVTLEEGNELQLVPGPYSCISLRLPRVTRPDQFVEETFSACALYGCEVRNLGTGARYWITSGRDGCLLLDGKAGEDALLRIYLPAGAAQPEQAPVGPPEVATVRAVAGAEPPAFDWFDRFRSHLVLDEDTGVEDTCFYRMERDGKPPVVFAASCGLRSGNRTRSRASAH